ncbi:MAG: signal recognition particle-docking protein FtsY [Candidatus Cloacimonetes bacterium]|nr:signal recognition particle-docking protein FtsY [Candidatus Cloacimonadota bacterium]
MLSFMKKLKSKLAKSKSGFVGKLAETIRLRGKVDEELMEELVEILIRSDVGVGMSEEIVEKLREEVRYHKYTQSQDVLNALQSIMSDLLLKDYEDLTPGFDFGSVKPYVILFIGVNGVGKTTTIGKLARRFSDEGKKVMLIAGDTFRAAAIEQLTIWADRSNVTIIKREQNSDPSSVVYDGIASAMSKGFDVVLIDTAGRQHNKVNLMNELNKIDRTIKKLIPEAPHETILVLDATTGQNAISQAKTFNSVVKLSGLTITKMDGTAKGGVVMGIKHELNIPIRLIGVGESVEDLKDFDAKEFVEAMFTTDDGGSEETEGEE